MTEHEATVKATASSGGSNRSRKSRRRQLTGHCPGHWVQGRALPPRPSRSPTLRPPGGTFLGRLSSQPPANLQSSLELTSNLQGALKPPESRPSPLKMGVTPFITELGDNPTSPQLPAPDRETVWIWFVVSLHFSPHMHPRGDLLPQVQSGETEARSAA